MADMRDFGKMDVNDRGGPHTYTYYDTKSIPATEGLTPSQTIGPFFAYGLVPATYGYSQRDVHSTDLTSPHLPGKRISIEGQVFDGEGLAIHDALIEIIQADTGGRYASTPRNDGFTGYGRCGTGAKGPESAGGDTRFRFTSIKPGATMEHAAPFINVIVTMRGLLNHCITRIYFPEDDHSTDPVMQQVPPDRSATLVAEKIAPDHYRFDIHMQGENETVFFDV